MNENEPRRTEVLADVKEGVIECDAVPVDRAKRPTSPEEKTVFVDGRWLWLAVLVAALFKVMLAVVVLVFFLFKFPRAMRLGLVSLLGLKALRDRNKNS